MIEYITKNPATTAAFLSLVATLLAAFATWQGPISAARLAENIRKNTEKENEKRRMKLQVFSTLMQERATIASIDSVRMLNSIDFVFSDSRLVREAWADLFSLLSGAQNPHPQLREDKLRHLLREMSIDIGLSDMMQVDDIARIYYPNALAQEEELQMLQRQNALLQMRSSGSAQQTSLIPMVEERFLTKFPPKPNAKK